MEDCVPVGNTLFRKLNLFALDEWQTTPHPDTRDLVNLSYFILYPAPFGGPFALVKDEAKIAQYIRDGRMPPVRIYTSTSSTKPISSFLWEGEKLLKILWTHDENLLCVQCNGTIKIVTMFGEKLREFKIDADRRLVNCMVVYSPDFSTTGFVALNTLGRILFIPDICAEGGQLKSFEDIPQVSVDSLKLSVSYTHNHIRLFAINGTDLYQIDLEGALEKLTYPMLNFNKFLDLAMSFTGEYLALLTDKSIIITTSGDPLHITIEHMLKDPVDSSCKLYWVGIDGVALFRPSFGLTIYQLMTSECHSEMLDLPVYFVPEIDGLRIITNGSHDLLHPVSPEVSEVLALGSQSPAMYLFEANKLFRENKPTAATEYLDEKVQMRLEEAVSRCISAAIHEYKPRVQKQLLEAANLGRCFLLSSSVGRLSWRSETAEMVRVIRILRVLNVIRDYIPGLPLTYKQFNVFYNTKFPLAGFQWLLLRLTRRKQATLAYSICDYLATADDCYLGKKANTISNEATDATPGTAPVSSPLHEIVLRAWSINKLNQNREGEESIAIALLDKLQKSNLLPEIARLAIDKNRKIVARKLIEAETRPPKQVPLLLQIGEYQLALGRAVASHNPDLISRVLDELRQEMDNASFLVLLHRHESAIKFYLHQLEERHDFDSYLKIADQESDFLGQAIFFLQASVRDGNDDPRDTLRRSSEQFGRKRGFEWAKDSVDSCRKLLDYQIKLDREMQTSIRRKSLSRTIRELGKFGRISTAVQLRKEFNMSEKAFWWAYANGLADGNNWQSLEEFTRGKAKTPFGIIGILEICALHNHFNSLDVNNYIDRLEPADRIKGLTVIGRFDKALEAAAKSVPKTAESDVEYLLKKLPPSHTDLKNRTKELLKQIRQHNQSVTGSFSLSSFRLRSSLRR